MTGLMKKRHLILNLVLLFVILTIYSCGDKKSDTIGNIKNNEEDIQSNVIGQQHKFKKITIVENNNPVLNYNYERLGLSNTINTNKFIELKKYVLLKIKIKSKTEP